MSNIYDKYYMFRQATTNDVDKIMKFIYDEWGKNHILAHNRKLFIYQYGRLEYNDKEYLNCILMFDKKDRILGMIGYVAYNNDRGRIQISPAMTKVVSSGLLPMTGVEFMRRQMHMVGEEKHFSSGTNYKTLLPIYREIFRHKTGIMQQWYILNEDVEFFEICRIKKRELCKFVYTNYKMEPVSDFDNACSIYDFDEDNERMSRKSKEFIRKRYFFHPIYKYKKWIIYDEEARGVGIIIGREICIKNRKLLRLVDYRGNLCHLKMIGGSLHKLLREEGYEYIDLMASDLTDYNLEMAGFSLLDLEGDNIIPNYFEPFIQENIKIFYQTDSTVVIFKADGDQDRPNRWK